MNYLELIRVGIGAGVLMALVLYALLKIQERAEEKERSDAISRDLWSDIAFYRNGVQYHTRYKGKHREGDYMVVELEAIPGPPPPFSHPNCRCSLRTERDE